MARLNSAPAPYAPSGPVATDPSAPPVLTHEGATGHTYDDKSALFLLATSAFHGEDRFYDSADDVHNDLVRLVHAVAAVDPGWVADFVRWLRGTANIRTAAIVAAVEYGRAARPAFPSATHPRDVLDSVLVRADEPGEALAYWLSAYGRPLPKWLKKGLGDGALRLYTERSALKYDSASTSRSVRFGDVVELSQIERNAADASGRSALLTHLINRRHNRPWTADDDASFPMLALNRALRSGDPAESRARILADPTLLDAAGMTWEALSSFGPMDAAAWEAVIPSLGFMATLRNLRNFEQAGISRDAIHAVTARLANRDEVARSRQLPLRFYSAYHAVESDVWRPALNDALDLSLANVPHLPGSTLVLIDTSGSMTDYLSARSKAQRWQVAALFGIVAAQASDRADVVAFSNNHGVFVTRPMESPMRAVERFAHEGLMFNGGTYTEKAVNASFTGQDRVIVLTDEQAGYYSYTGRDDVYGAIPSSTPVYTFNLAGYSVGSALTSPNRHTVAGLSDAGFTMIASIESAAATRSRAPGSWPWETAEVTA